jgi:hypothetical protein
LPRALDPCRLRLRGRHARHLLGLRPADASVGNRFAQRGQAVQVVGQALELPEAIAGKTEPVHCIQFQRGVTQHPIQLAPLHLGEPEDGTTMGLIGNRESLAQGGVDRTGGLTGREFGQGLEGHGGLGFREEGRAFIVGEI